MKYVLDASVAVKWVLPEDGSDKAIALQEAFEEAVHELLAPDVLPIEVAHALTRAERRSALQPGEAINRLSSMLATLPNLFPYLPLLPRAVELSSKARVGVYDCLYVALAEQERCQVVSADERLVNSFSKNVILLSSL